MVVENKPWYQQQMTLDLKGPDVNESRIQHIEFPSPYFEISARQINRTQRS